MKGLVKLIAIVPILYCWIASAHEHWLDCDNYYPAVGARTKLRLCSGHAFPKSDLVLKQHVLYRTIVVKPEGETISYKTIEYDQHRLAEADFDTAGVHIVMFELKKPQMEKPLYYAKSIIVVGGKNDKEQLYSITKGLEIVPGKTLTSLALEDELPLIVLYDGQRVNARISIIPEKGKSTTLTTTSERPAQFKISSSGRHLLTSCYKGKSCSLTFSVRNTEVEQ